MANDSRFNLVVGQAQFDAPLVMTLTHPVPESGKEYQFEFSYEYSFGNVGVGTASYFPGLTLVSKTETTRSYICVLTMDNFTALKPGGLGASYFASASSIDMTIGMKIGYQGIGNPFYEIAENSYEVSVVVPENKKPIVTAEYHPVNTIGKLDEWGIYVKGKSSIGFTVDATAQYGSKIKGGTLRAGNSYGASWPAMATETFSWSSSFLLDDNTDVVNIFIEDTRGFVKEISSDILIYDYEPPVIKDVISYRCDADGTPNPKGTSLRAQCLAACTSLGGRNTITAVTAKYGTTILGNEVSMVNGVEQVIATGLDPNTLYTVEFSAKDAVGESATEAFTGDKPRTAMHLKDGGKGFGVGKKSVEDGFHCGWEATFDGNVAVLGDVTIGGKSLVDIIYPVGSIYLSVTGANPALMFGGTWEKIKDRFLLGAGDVYATGDVGGEAEVTLIATQIPKHFHKVKGYTNTDLFPHNHRISYVTAGTNGATFGLKAESVGYGTREDFIFTESNAYSAMDAYNSHDHYINVDTADTPLGDGAHNNMPPYCVVNVWKRTA